MTKKHYIAIADAIRSHNHFASDTERFGVSQLECLANVLRQQNPNFKTQKWLDYIAVES